MSMDFARIATLTNITDEDFTHPYHGRPFTILAGESLLFPYDLARHLAKHLSRKILMGQCTSEQLKNDRALFGPGDEETIIQKLLGPATQREVPAELSDDERLLRRVEELNSAPPEGAPKGRTKVDVIAEMEAKGLPVDKRKSMETLEDELAKSKSV